ncbi:hypothetical protein [Nocardia albiluteola]|nr:hypothetical protein [Nocardia albiluteola]
MAAPAETALSATDSPVSVVEQALATWGTQPCVYFLAYRALHNHN